MNFSGIESAHGVGTGSPGTSPALPDSIFSEVISKECGAKFLLSAPGMTWWPPRRLVEIRIPKNTQEYPRIPLGRNRSRFSILSFRSVLSFLPLFVFFRDTSSAFQKNVFDFDEKGRSEK